MSTSAIAREQKTAHVLIDNTILCFEQGVAGRQSIVEGTSINRISKVLEHSLVINTVQKPPLTPPS